MNKISIGIGPAGARFTGNNRHSSLAAKLAVIGSALLLSSMTWASTGACSSTEALSKIGSGTGNGCADIDQTFSNFNVTNAGGATPVQSASTVDVGGSSTWTADATSWSNTETLSGDTGSGSDTAAPWTSAGHNTELAGTISFITNSTDSSPYFSPSGYPAVPSGDSILIDNLTFGAAGSTGSSWGSSVKVTESFCIGASACTTGGSGDMITLTASFSGVDDSIASYTCSVMADAHASCGSTGPSSSPITVTFATPASTLNFVDDYNLVEGNNGSAASLTDFYNTFGNQEEVAEPSTFLLLGTALTGFGLLRARRKKA